jgi:hypothetical protein
MNNTMETVGNPLPEIIGGAFDAVFLTMPKIINLFRKPRMIARHNLEAELDYYFEQGFVQNPRDFFTFPQSVPAHEIVYRKPFKDGEYQVVAYKSSYEPRNPLVRDRFSSFPENRTGYLIRWTRGNEGAKTVLCLHGYLLGHPRQAERMFKVDRLFGKGLDVALFIDPFHWRRRPANKDLRGIFLQPEDPAMTCECFGQAIHDLTAAMGILRRLSSGPVGIIGASLGGYLSALFSCLQDTHDFAAMMVPSVDFTTPLGPETAKLPFPLDRDLLGRMEQVYRLHSPLHFTPMIPKENILIIASRGDRLCPHENIERLCSSWGDPEHYFLRGGHWIIFDNSLRGRAWYSFLDRMGYL